MFSPVGKKTRVVRIANYQPFAFSPKDDRQRRVVGRDEVVGPVKAALASVTRYAAAALGEKGVSVQALSPGPLQMRAASGVNPFDQMPADAAMRAPTHVLVSIEHAGAYAAFRSSPAAANVTGGVHPIDGGFGIVD